MNNSDSFQNNPPPKPSRPRKPKAPVIGLVGTYIRKKREEMGLSQKVLGQKLTPPVTTQFISNVERGVTPLPPTHVTSVVQVLKLSEPELLAVMEQEYIQKLSGRVGQLQSPPHFNSQAVIPISQPSPSDDWLKALITKYSELDLPGKEALKKKVLELIG